MVTIKGPNAVVRPVSDLKLPSYIASTPSEKTFELLSEVLHGARPDRPKLARLMVSEALEQELRVCVEGEGLGTTTQQPRSILGTTKHPDSRTEAVVVPPKFAALWTRPPHFLSRRTTFHCSRFRDSV